MTEPRLRPGGLPALEEVRPLGRTEITRFHGGYRLIDSLKQLGLALYDEGCGYYWFGAEDLPAMLAHDRWLYRVEQGVIEESASWEDVDYTRVSECGTVFVDVRKDRGANMLFLIENLASYFRQFSNMPESKQIERVQLKRYLLSTYQSFGVLNQEMVGMVWTQTSHDVLHHPEAWAARNEMVDMPRDLLLRMYGLGHYADELECGRDWLDY